MDALVSIIIPNYNKARYIAETLDSCLNQSYSNWEAIVVDDCSSDHSIETIKGYCNQDNRFKLIELDENKGGAFARNQGLKEARGAYTLFLDSDDLLHKDCLTHRVQSITNSPEGFQIFPVGTFYEKTGDSKMVWKANQGDYLKQFLSHNLPWNITSVFWETQSLKTLGGFNTNFKRFQDVELHTRALLLGLKYSISHQNKPDSYYRIHPERTILGKKEALTLKWQSAVQYINHFSLSLKKEGLSTYTKHLKGTKFSMLNTLLVEKNREASLAYLKALTDEGLLTKWEHLYLKVYTKLYRLGFSKLKGFNFLMKKAFSMLT